MTGTLPAFKILTKPEGSEKFSEIGALWTTSKADIFSVRLNINGQELSGIMVKNSPKPATEPTTPAAKKRTAPARTANA